MLSFVHSNCKVRDPRARGPSLCNVPLQYQTALLSASFRGWQSKWALFLSDSHCKLSSFTFSEYSNIITILTPSIFTLLGFTLGSCNWQSWNLYFLVWKIFLRGKNAEIFWLCHLQWSRSLLLPKRLFFLGFCKFSQSSGLNHVDDVRWLLYSGDPTLVCPPPLSP